MFSSISCLLDPLRHAFFRSLHLTNRHRTLSGPSRTLNEIASDQDAICALQSLLMLLELVSFHQGTVTFWNQDRRLKAEQVISHVYNGGALVVAMCPWGWQQLNSGELVPSLCLLDD